MDPFTDYYAVLGVNETASTSTIKAAFKKLALQYHPDVYKGQDAQERMRTLLLAYQTLSDEASRRAYDAQRTEYLLDKPGRRVRVATQTAPSGRKVSSSARRDRQRHYDFPDLSDELPAQINLGDITYTLSPTQARTLKEEGMLRGVEQKSQRSGVNLVCHRCHYHWEPAPGRNPAHPWEDLCPACKASDWAEYLLLRCIHCTAVFESEQIRYEIGSLQYGDDNLCPPYELFPLCPYCGTSKWCPAEDARIATLRAVTARRATMLRFIWISAALIAVVVIGVMALILIR